MADAVSFPDNMRIDDVISCRRSHSRADTVIFTYNMRIDDIIPCRGLTIWLVL
ncbi:MAG: hypothetical protein IJR63_03850 [Synergistaceae bacterium]|nr:hypothetical protein [Synergistaceae bacterium]